MLCSELFIIYLTNLVKASNTLDPIMFANDTNFYPNNNFQDLFLTKNTQFPNITRYLPNVIKSSLNVGKTKYYLFHKSSKRMTKK